MKEETGLDVSNLQFKILYEYVNPKKNDRYIIFNYITKDFKGTLLEDPTEGKPVWVPISETSNLPMQKSIRRSFPYFFEEGTYEIQVVWDDDKNEEASISIKRT